MFAWIFDCVIMWLHDFKICIDASLNSPGSDIFLDTKIMFLAVIDLVLAPNSSNRFSVKLSREERPSPCLKEYMAIMYTDKKFKIFNF